jgi:hypothetical protein
MITMKHLILALLLIPAGASLVRSQNSVPEIAFDKANPVGHKKAVFGQDNNGAISPAAVSPKASKDFSKTCKMASDCRWYSCENKGTIVYYQLGEKKARRFYNQKGNFVYDIQSFGEESLPFDVRDLVKRTYYMDYHIDMAQEVNTNDGTYFIIHISDARTIKTLAVFEGEIILLKDLNKSM